MQKGGKCSQRRKRGFLTSDKTLQRRSEDQNTLKNTQNTLNTVKYYQGETLPKVVSPTKSSN